VLEALGAGLPVITTRYNGVSELLTDGVDGCVLDDPADLDGFLARLEPLFSPAVRQPMSRGARQLALQHTLDRNCDEIEAVYREVAAVRRRDQAA
jgi:UDP-glucose:(heptosyl)LPS alpha-1,3-glucosyltransferase